MKIIHSLAGTRLDHGGTSRCVPSLCETLSQHGIDVHFLTSRPCDRNAPYILPHTPVISHLIDESPLFGRAFVGNQYESVLQTIKSEFNGDVQENLLIHDHGIWLSLNHAAANCARHSKIIRIVSPHGMLSQWAISRSRWKKKLAWWIYQHADLNSADAFHVTSKQEADEVRAFGLKQPIAIIANGVSFAERPYSRLRQNKLRQMLFLSRIHPKKGIIELVRAWKKANVGPEWELLIVGPNEGGHQEQVEREVRELGLSGVVRIGGPVDDVEKWQIYADADIYILPSFSENFGIVIAEALAAGLPVITTTGTPWSELRERGCGWWVEPTVDDLAATIATATNLPPERLIEMGQVGKAWVSKSFTWEAVCSQMIQFYQWMLGKCDRPEFVDVYVKHYGVGDYANRSSSSRGASTAQLKVIHTIAGTRFDHGGTSRSVPSLCDALCRRGLDVDFLGTRPPGQNAPFNLPHPPVVAHLVNESQVFGRALVGSEYTEALRNWREKVQQNSTGRQISLLVHDHGIWLAPNHAVANFSRMSNVIRVVSPRGMLSSWAISQNRLKKQLAWLTYQHSDLQCATAFHVTSKQEADEVRSLGFKQPIAIIGNGVSFATGTYQRQLDTRTRRMLFLSRIHPKKGVIELVRAWKQANVPSDWDLVIAGPGDNLHQNTVEHEIRKLGLADVIRCVGPLDDVNKWQAYADADVFILPSFSENFGTVIPEAMAAGVPVITTTGTPWGELQTRGCGWWVAPTVDELSAAIAAATRMPPNELAAMGSAGKVWVRETFDWDSIAERMVRFYEWLLGKSDPLEFIDIGN